MSRHVVRTVLVFLLALVVPIPLGASVPAWAGEDRGLCKADNTRVTIPGDFPLRACFDGATLYLLNGTQYPTSLTFVGDEVGDPERYAQSKGPGASQMLAYIRPGDFLRSPAINAPHFRSGVIPPDYYVKVGIGDGPAEVRVAPADEQTQQMYLIAELIWRYFPLKGTPEDIKSVAELSKELWKVSDEYRQCLQRSNNAWGDAGCLLLVERNMAFAVVRAGFNFAAKDLPKAVVSLFETSKWADASTKDLLDFRNGTLSFTIAAAPPPAARPVDPGPKAPAGGNAAGSNSPPSEERQEPPAHEEAPREEVPPVVEAPPIEEEPRGEEAPPIEETPPPPLVAVVQNMHLAGAHGLEEDPTPAYLSSAMQPYCARDGCKVDGTDMWSGDSLEAICWDTGATMTNENWNIPDDDANPNLVYYDAWLWGKKNGQTGYISYVYLTPESRSLSIPHC